MGLLGAALSGESFPPYWWTSASCLASASGSDAATSGRAMASERAGAEPECAPGGKLLADLELVRCLCRHVRWCLMRRRRTEHAEGGIGTTEQSDTRDDQGATSNTLAAAPSTHPDDVAALKDRRRPARSRVWCASSRVPSVSYGWITRRV